MPVAVAKAVGKVHAPQPRFLKAIAQPPYPPVCGGLRVLKSVSSNRKVGKGSDLVQKGPFSGLRLFALTLAERITCASTCLNWNRCYGNNTPFAKRHLPGPHLEQAVIDDILWLRTRSVDGFAVRLHVLGDFYGVGYVKLWGDLLSAYEGLHICGHTHRMPGTPIGDAVTQLVHEHKGRAMVMRSDGGEGDPLPRAVTVEHWDDKPKGFVACPTQTKHTVSCLECGLCMDGRTQVAFLVH